MARQSTATAETTTDGTAPAARTDEQRQEASDKISTGAEPCKDCGNVPHGMALPRAVAGLGTFDVYVVGCLVCRDHRAMGKTPEEAVEKWNAGDYMAPSVQVTQPANAPEATEAVAAVPQ